VREARDHLLSVRLVSVAVEALSCGSPLSGLIAEDGVALRLNLVWDGRLRDTVSAEFERGEEIEKRLHALWATRPAPHTRGADMPVAVAQGDLDTLLAVRRWYKESEATSIVVLPGPDAEREEREQARERLLVEAWHVLTTWPAGRAAGSIV
jgi:hypothetical protein